MLREQEDEMFTQLVSVREEQSFTDLDEAALFVIDWAEMYDPYFVDYCEGYVARYSRL